MRRVYVNAPKLGSRVELNRRQKAINSAAEARRAWNNYRQSVRSQDVVDAFRQAAGVRMRCFYCSDSRATDVDHFVPMSVDFKGTFKWKNYIWVCTSCNRYKGSRFPRDAQTGSALLVNPTTEDPWMYLILDTDTGVLAPRYWLEGFDPKGTATLQILKPINYESAIEGRMRTITRLREAVLQVSADGSPGKTINEGLRKLLDEVRHDEFGVSAWFGIWDGKDEDDFRNLAMRNVTAWRHFVRASVKVRYGEIS